MAELPPGGVGAAQHFYKVTILPIVALLLLPLLLFSPSADTTATALSTSAGLPYAHKSSTIPAAAAASWLSAAILPYAFELGPPAFPPPDNVSTSVALSALLRAHFWRNFTSQDARDCIAGLRGGAVLFVGDSNTREIVNALFDSQGLEPIPKAWGHSRFERSLRGGGRVAFSFATSLPDIAAAIEEDSWVAGPTPPAIGAIVCNSGVWDSLAWSRGASPPQLLSGRAARMAVFLRRMRLTVLPLLARTGAPPPLLVWRTTSPSLDPLLSAGRMGALATLDKTLLAAWNREAGGRGVPAWAIIESGEFMPAHHVGRTLLPDGHHPNAEVTFALVQATLNTLCGGEGLSVEEVEALGSDAAWCGGEDGGVEQVCLQSLGGLVVERRFKPVPQPSA